MTHRQETIDRVRHFMKRGEYELAWQAVRTREEAIRETRCPECRRIADTRPSIDGRTLSVGSPETRETE